MKVFTVTHSRLVFAKFILLCLSSWRFLEANIVHSLARRWWGIDAMVCGSEGPVGFGFWNWTIAKSRSSSRQFFHICGWEEALFSMNLASPPVGVCLIYNFDDIARGEG